SFAQPAPVMSSNDKSGNATPTVRYSSESIVLRDGSAETTSWRFHENSATRKSATNSPIKPPNSTGFEVMLSFRLDAFCLTHIRACSGVTACCDCSDIHTLNAGYSRDGMSEAGAPRLFIWKKSTINTAACSTTALLKDLQAHFLNVPGLLK